MRIPDAEPNALFRAPSMHTNPAVLLSSIRLSFVRNTQDQERSGLVYVASDHRGEAEKNRSGWLRLMRAELLTADKTAGAKPML